MINNLDAIIVSIITNPKHLEEVYLKDTDHTIYCIYDTDKYSVYKLDLFMLKNELQNPHLVKKYIKRISKGDKLTLLKDLFPITYYSDTDYVSWETISRLFCEDKWDELIKHYMYYRAYNIIDDKEGTTYLKIEYILQKIDFNRRFLNDAKKIAIDKIRRNSIYNFGLGLKIATRQYTKDFN